MGMTMPNKPNSMMTRKKTLLNPVSREATQSGIDLDFEVR
jgi:hypothetical protein